MRLGLLLLGAALVALLYLLIRLHRWFTKIIAETEGVVEDRGKEK